MLKLSKIEQVNKWGYVKDSTHNFNVVLKACEDMENNRISLKRSPRSNLEANKLVFCSESDR